MQICTNQFCPGRDQGFSATTGFDFMVNFSDHTGTLHGCTLRSPVAEKTLGCTVSISLQKPAFSASVLNVLAPTATFNLFVSSQKIIAF